MFSKKKANKNNKLGVKGVYKLKNGHYQAKIQYYNQTYTKSSSCLEEVVRWRKSKEIELYGEFAYNEEGDALVWAVAYIHTLIFQF